MGLEFTNFPVFAADLTQHVTAFNDDQKKKLYKVASRIEGQMRANYPVMRHKVTVKVRQQAGGRGKADLTLLVGPLKTPDGWVARFHNFGTSEIGATHFAERAIDAGFSEF